MKAPTQLFLASLAAFCTFCSGATAKEHHCSTGPHKGYHRGHHRSPDRFVHEWLAYWNGDKSLLNDLVAPNVVMYQDRAPSASGHGSDVITVNSSKVFDESVTFALSPYSSYHFDLIGWASTDNIVAVRWTLNGALKNTQTSKDTSTKKDKPFSLNGTDFIFLNKCTGLVQQYDLAVDNVAKYHQRGYSSIPV